MIDRAIAARGGPLRSFRRTVDVRAYAGFPGDWRLETEFLLPDLYRWTVHTATGADHYVWNGEMMLAYVGGALVARDASAQAPLRSHARWTAVTSLDALRSDPLPLNLKCSGSEVEAVFADDASTYRLHFDEEMRLVRAIGPISMPPLGSGELTVDYARFRPLSGMIVATELAYSFHGQRLFDERLVNFQPNDPAVTPSLFGR